MLYLKIKYLFKNLVLADRHPLGGQRLHFHPFEFLDPSLILRFLELLVSWWVLAEPPSNGL